MRGGEGDREQESKDARQRDTLKGKHLALCLKIFSALIMTLNAPQITYDARCLHLGGSLMSVFMFHGFALISISH